jgi:hypothetical protein
MNCICSRSRLCHRLIRTRRNWYRPGHGAGIGCGFRVPSAVGCGRDGGRLLAGSPRFGGGGGFSRDRYGEVAEKVAAWLAAGTRTVAVHCAGGIIRTLREGDVLEGREEVPGREVPVTALFA